MVLPDSWIRQQALDQRMIEPFEETLQTTGVLSFGVSSAGYDIRMAGEFKIFTNINNAIIDPKQFDPDAYVDFSGPICLIPPHSFVLARSIEYIRMPAAVIALLQPKSTYVRSGILTPSTVLEPGWEGHVTLEIANMSSLPARVYSGEGIAQIIFFAMLEKPTTDYATRGGKYQNQTGITLPRI